MLRAHRLGLLLLLGVSSLGLEACTKDRDNGPGGYCRADDWCHAGLICVARECRQLPGVPPATDASVDSGRADTSVNDSGTVDTGPEDSGAVDSGVMDSGPEDSGPADSGPADSGPADSGPADSGSADTGPVDASVAG